MIFPAGNVYSLIHRIERIMSQPQLYAQISDALAIALRTVKVPACWDSLIDYWLSSEANKANHQQLCNWAFSSGRYRHRRGLTKLARSASTLGFT